jgi:hypothetical protein
MKHKKLISELYQMLNPNDKINYQHVDPTKPHDVTGVFIQRGVSSLDGSILESVGSLTWEEVADLALLSKINRSNLIALSSTYAKDGVSEFRYLWNEMLAENHVLPGMGRGSIVLLNKVCDHMESQLNYVHWCQRIMNEAPDEIKDSLIEKSETYKMVIPSGETMAQHNRDVNNAKPYQGKEFIEPYEGPGQFDTRKKGLEKVKETERILAKAAAKVGKAPDEVFNNAYHDLARERARNS